MGFLDDVAADLEGGGGDYVGKDEKSELISKSVPFTISALERGKTRFKDDAFTLTVQIAGEDRKMEFGYGTMKDPTEATSRDRTLQKLLDSGELDAGPVGPVILAKANKGVNAFVVIVPVGTDVDSEGVLVR